MRTFRDVPGIVAAQDREQAAKKAYLIALEDNAPNRVQLMVWWQEAHREFLTVAARWFQTVDER